VASRKYILSATDFKKLTPVHKNTDDQLIKQSIISCQDMFIQFITGSTLLDEIKDQLPSSLTALNQTLLEDYIHNAMLYWVMADILDPLTFRATNIGVQVKDSERSQSAELEELRRLEGNYRSKAMFYADRTIKYLRENKSSYPLYENPGTGIDVIRPQGSAYRSSIYLGGVRGKRYGGMDVYYGEEWNK